MNSNEDFSKILGERIKQFNAEQKYMEENTEIVTRCKNCEHRGDESKCLLWSLGIWTDDDFYCAYGERRSDWRD